MWPQRQYGRVDKLPDQLTLRRGQKQVVRLPSSAGGGYRWQATADDDSIVGAEVAFDHAVTTAAGEAAFSPHELLTLEGRAIGATRVYCVQRRGWERDTLPLGEHALIVNVVAEGDGDSTKKKGSHARRVANSAVR